MIDKWIAEYDRQVRDEMEYLEDEAEPRPNAELLEFTSTNAKKIMEGVFAHCARKNIDAPRTDVFLFGKSIQLRFRLCDHAVALWFHIREGKEYIDLQLVNPKLDFSQYKASAEQLVQIIDDTVLTELEFTTTESTNLTEEYDKLLKFVRTLYKAIQKAETSSDSSYSCCAHDLLELFYLSDAPNVTTEH